MPVILATIAGAAGKAVLSLIGSMASQKFFEWAFLWGAERLVTSTETPHDDEFLAAVKAAHEAAKSK
jgi:hypothetical protein